MFPAHAVNACGLLSLRRLRALGSGGQTPIDCQDTGDSLVGRDVHELVFGWDNERPRAVADVAEFAIDRHDVTNAAYFEFVAAGGYGDSRWWRPDDWEWIQSEGLQHPLFWERHDGEWQWRGMFDLVPLPPAWPVYVSQAEASAYAAWRGCRLPSEAEFQRAAYGTLSGTERQHPWGDTPPAPRHGVLRCYSA